MENHATEFIPDDGFCIQANLYTVNLSMQLLICKLLNLWMICDVFLLSDIVAVYAEASTLHIIVMSNGRPNIMYQLIQSIRGGLQVLLCMVLLEQTSKCHPPSPCHTTIMYDYIHYTMHILSHRIYICPSSSFFFFFFLHLSTQDVFGGLASNCLQSQAHSDFSHLR